MKWTYGLIVTVASVSLVSAAWAKVPTDPKEREARINLMNEKIGKLYEAQNAKNAAGAKVRTFHSKGVCANATIKILPGIPADLQVGPFKHAGHEYKGYWRASNGSGFLQPDPIPDVSGGALKITGVKEARFSNIEGMEKETLDLIGINYPLFFGSNDNFNEAVDAMMAAAKGDQLAFLKVLLKEKLTRRIVVTNAMLPRPGYLKQRYWSQTPWQFGKHTVKVSFTPCKDVPLSYNLPKSLEGVKDYLTVDFQEMLKQPKNASEKSKKLACMVVSAQIQKDPEAMPTEDPQVWWAEPGYFSPIDGVVLPENMLISDLVKLAQNIEKHPVTQAVLQDKTQAAEELKSILDFWLMQINIAKTTTEILGDTKATLKDALHLLPDEVVSRLKKKWVVSPFIPLAEVTFDAQDVKGTQAFCESMSMNPANALADVYPVGLFNEARMKIYTDRAKARRSQNSVKTAEPTGDLAKDLAVFAELNKK